MGFTRRIRSTQRLKGFQKTPGRRPIPTRSPVESAGGDNKMMPDDWNPEADWIEFPGGSHVDPNPFHFGLPVVRTFDIRDATDGSLRLVEIEKSDAHG